MLNAEGFASKFWSIFLLISRHVTGARRWSSLNQKRSLPGIVPAFACSGPGGCGMANPDDPSFPARSEI